MPAILFGNRQTTQGGPVSVSLDREEAKVFMGPSSSPTPSSGRGRCWVFPLMFVLLGAVSPPATLSAAQGNQLRVSRGTASRVVGIAGRQWHVALDALTGGVRSANGPGIPWIAGRGNSLRAPTVGGSLLFLAGRAENFARDERSHLGLAGYELRFDGEHSRGFGAPPYLYVLIFRVLALGVPVQDARATFVVNNGNFVAFSVSAPPKPPTRAMLVLKQAVAQRLAFEELVRKGKVRKPEFRGTTLAWRFADGGWALSWEGLVRDRSTGILYRVTTSAESGKVLEVRSLRADGQATGGVRLHLLGDPQTLTPLRGVTISDGAKEEVTDAAGRFSLTGASLSGTLSGPYATVADGCGSDSITGDSSRPRVRRDARNGLCFRRAVRARGHRRVPDCLVARQPNQGPLSEIRRRG